MDWIEQTQEDRERDVAYWQGHDQDLCMLCQAQGEDKRSLFISCFYAVNEVIPEAIDLTECPDNVKDRGYYLRICKNCRGELLDMLGEWRAGCVQRRGTPMNRDGYSEESIPGADIPMRVNGRIVMMTTEQYEDYRKSREE